MVESAAGVADVSDRRECRSVKKVKVAPIGVTKKSKGERHLLWQLACQCQLQGGQEHDGLHSPRGDLEFRPRRMDPARVFVLPVSAARSLTFCFLPPQCVM